MYEDFAAQYRSHVLEVCQRELEPAIVDATTERILKTAFQQSQASDKGTGYWIGWTIAIEMKELRTPERRAELDAEWATYER